MTWSEIQALQREVRAKARERIKAEQVGVSQDANSGPQQKMMENFVSSDDDAGKDGQRDEI